MNITHGISELELARAANEQKNLSTNFGEIAMGCLGLQDATAASLIQDRFPLVQWLMNTPMSASERAKAERGLTDWRKDSTTGKYMLGVPGQFWTELPQDTQGQCCFVPLDFSKCQGEVPMYILCIKDCEDIEDEIMAQILRIGSRDAVSPFSYRGETLKAVQERVTRMSMMFYTAHTLIQGMVNATTPLTKPFHGLMSVMENPAVLHRDGSNILAAFKELECRMMVLGLESIVFAAHPLVVNAIKLVVKKGENGEYPEGWSYVGDEIRFHGRRFIEDKLVPFSMADGTGDVWMLSGDAVGAFLGADLTGGFKKSGFDATGSTCGVSCDYYFNIGAVFNNEANKLAVLTDVPVASNCINAVADLAGIVDPQTLVPKGTNV